MKTNLPQKDGVELYIDCIYIFCAWRICSQLFCYLGVKLNSPLWFVVCLCAVFHTANVTGMRLNCQRLKNLREKRSCFTVGVQPVECYPEQYKGRFTYCTDLFMLYKRWRMAFFSARPRLLWAFDCETKIQTPHWLCKKFETARRSEPRKKRDCETREF